MSSTTRPASDPGGASEVLLRAAERELHTERIVKELAYVVLGLPLGAAYLVLVVGGAVIGAVLGALWVGVPLLFAVSGVLWRCATVERRLANRLLEARIPTLPPLRAAGDGLWQRLRHRVGSRSFWRAVALLTLRLPMTAAAALVIASGVFAAAALLVIGVGGITGTGGGYFGPVPIDPGVGIALCALAIPVAVLTIAAIDVSGYVLRAMARSLLVTSLPAGAPVRDSLVLSIGDRTLTIAYWLPDRGGFVDERGNPVELPEPGSDRAWTPVDYLGRRVAAIIHDASLEAGPELVEAAAAAASLALDNERLKADLRARVQELRVSRMRVVEASNAARRKVERDLHDGAQQQLVSMAIELRLLRNRIDANPAAAELVDRLDAKLTAALEELRALARGLHPGILSDRGLSPALESLASSAPIDVACEIDLPSRPPAAVEAVAYYVVAEALTNVLKYAQADTATIRARYEGDHVIVETEDDGIGGATEGKGTGLQGLRDRVGALDGTFTVVSPAGGGTVVGARIPLAEDA